MLRPVSSRVSGNAVQFRSGRATVIGKASRNATAWTRPEGPAPGGKGGLVAS